MKIIKVILCLLLISLIVGCGQYVTYKRKNDSLQDYLRKGEQVEILLTKESIISTHFRNPNRHNSSSETVNTKYYVAKLTIAQLLDPKFKPVFYEVGEYKGDLTIIRMSGIPSVSLVTRCGTGDQDFQCEPYDGECVYTPEVSMHPPTYGKIPLTIDGEDHYMRLHFYGGNRSYGDGTMYVKIYDLDRNKKKEIKKEYDLKRGKVDYDLIVGGECDAVG